MQNSTKLLFVHSFPYLFGPDPDPDPTRAKTCGSVRIRIRNPAFKCKIQCQGCNNCALATQGLQMYNAKNVFVSIQHVDVYKKRFLQLLLSRMYLCQFSSVCQSSKMGIKILVAVEAFKVGCEQYHTTLLSMMHWAGNL